MLERSPSIRLLVVLDHQSLLADCEQVSTFVQLHIHMHATVSHEQVMHQVVFACCTSNMMCIACILFMCIPFCFRFVLLCDFKTSSVIAVGLFRNSAWLYLCGCMFIKAHHIAGTNACMHVYHQFCITCILEKSHTPVQLLQSQNVLLIYVGG